MPEVYQLPRGREESVRLDTQHIFMRDLCEGNLAHPLIPVSQVAKIADVATGTGVWLEDCAARLRASSTETDLEFVGFDISPSQFPQGQGRDDDGLTFVAHDMTYPFPQEYYGHFDLVNIRLVSPGVPLEDLSKALLNILDILRPGGYLQWLDVDASNIWTKPFNSVAQTFIRRISEEKAAKDLSLCFSQDVLKDLLSLKVVIPLEAASIDLGGRRLNLVSRSDCPYRLLTYEQFPTSASAELGAAGHKVVSSAYRSMLKKSARDNRAASKSDDRLSAAGRETLMNKAEVNEQIIVALEGEEDAGTFQFQWSLTWMVAQKAIFVGHDDDWLNAGHSLPSAKSG